MFMARLELLTLLLALEKLLDKNEVEAAKELTILIHHQSVDKNQYVL